MTSQVQPQWMSFFDIIQQARMTIQEMGLQAPPGNLLNVWVSQGNQQFARETNTAKDEDLRVMVKGQRRYRLPNDCLTVDRVSVNYPGFTQEDVLRSQQERDVIQFGLESDPQGTPRDWYLTRKRDEIGLDPTPVDGGFEGVTTAIGTTTTLIDTNLGTTDDVHIGQTLRILDGTEAGTDVVVTDYDGTTVPGTLTFTPATAGLVDTAVSYELHPESLKIQYTAAGNRFEFGVIEAATVAPLTSRTIFGLDLVSRPRNFYKGREIQFLSDAGPLALQRVRIIRSEASGVYEVTPGLTSVPANAKKVAVTEVPNIEPSFHPSLVNYLVFMTTKLRGDPRMNTFSGEWFAAKNEGIEASRPETGQTYQRVRESRIGEEEYYD